MAGVQADQGHVRRQDNPPPPTSSAVQRLKVTPENVLDLAQVFFDVIEALEPRALDLGVDLRLSNDAFLGDPYSKWAVGEFNNYFVAGEVAFATVVMRLIVEHKRTFNALKATAETYGQADEWNARKLGEAFELT